MNSEELGRTSIVHLLDRFQDAGIASLEGAAYVLAPLTPNLSARGERSQSTGEHFEPKFGARVVRPLTNRRNGSAA